MQNKGSDLVRQILAEPTKLIDAVDREAQTLTGDHFPVLGEATSTADRAERTALGAIAFMLLSQDSLKCMFEELGTLDGLFANGLIKSCVIALKPLVIDHYPPTECAFVSELRRLGGPHRNGVRILERCREFVIVNGWNWADNLETLRFESYRRKTVNSLINARNFSDIQSLLEEVKHR
jgi:hypothetical protein